MADDEFELITIFDEDDFPEDFYVLGEITVDELDYVLLHPKSAHFAEEVVIFQVTVKDDVDEEYNNFEYDDVDDATYERIYAAAQSILEPIGYWTEGEEVGPDDDDWDDDLFGDDDDDDDGDPPVYVLKDAEGGELHLHLVAIITEPEGQFAVMTPATYPEGEPFQAMYLFHYEQQGNEATIFGIKDQDLFARVEKSAQQALAEILADRHDELRHMQQLTAEAEREAAGIPAPSEGVGEPIFDLATAAPPGKRSIRSDVN